MSLAIHWHLMFRVSKRLAFNKCLDRALLILGDTLDVGQGEAYWKRPELWECVVITPIPVGSAVEQVGRSILLAQQLASGWYVLGSDSSQSAEGFSGVFSLGFNNGASKTLGLEWASFHIRPYPASNAAITEAIDEPDPASERGG